MLVTNNYQPNFKGLKFNAMYNSSVEKEVKDIFYSKLPKEEVDKFFSTLRKSPIETTLGLADSKTGARLDATVYYKKPLTGDEIFKYIEEKKLANLFNIKPTKFVERVLKCVESFEKKI